MLIVVCVTAICMIVPALQTAMQIDMGNEGWLAMSALALFEGRSLYLGPDEFFVTNYLPLSYALYAGLHALTGDLIMAGRWLSWLAFALLVGAASAITWSITRQLPAAALSAVLLAASFARWYAGNLGLADPQLVGHLFGLAAVWVFVTRGVGWRPLIVATGLLLVGGLVKQTLFGFPLGIALWLWSEYPRRFQAWLLASALSVAAISCLLFVIFGPAMLENVLLGRVYSVKRWFTNMRLVTTLVVPLIVSTILLRTHRSDPRIRLVLYLILGSSIEAAILAAAQGTTFSIGYDLAIAASIGAGVGIGSLRDGLSSKLGRYGLISIVALAELARMTHGITFSRVAAVRELYVTHDRAAPELIALLASIPGEALCQELAYCYWAGKKTRADLKMRAAHLFAPPRNHRPLVARIERREFQSIVWSGATGPISVGAALDIFDAIQKHYRVLRTFETSVPMLVFVPLGL